MENNDPIFLRIEEAMKISGKSTYTLTKFFRLDDLDYQIWKHQGSRSYLKILPEIARFLEVREEWLRTGEGEPQ